MDDKKLWKKVEAFFHDNFDTEPNPELDVILFLIGVQELGSGLQKFSKDDKLDLIHIAVCRLLEPYGYYKFESYTEDGWPKYSQIQTMPVLKPNEQSILIRKAIIQYLLTEKIIAED